MNKDFWTQVYQSDAVTQDPSPFARFCLPLIKGPVVDLGCGNGRDVYFFHNEGLTVHGVDAANEDYLIIKQDIGAYMKQNPCIENVYTRFFWHAIEPRLQNEILDWTTGRIFIEARTTKDRPQNVVGRHKRNLVDTNKLRKQLKDFKIVHWEEGTGRSPYLGEDPHLVRVVADKVV